MAIRIDRVSVPDWISSKFTTDSDGNLVGRASVTNIGVFTYRHPDGTVVRELRTPEEVFSADSMESIKNVPITVDHPTTLVPTEGIVGETGDKPLCGDSIYLSVDMFIKDKEAIEEVKKGKQYLSCGYSADIEMESGRWLGMEYDARQKNIRYSHVSLVDSPRAGETAMIRLDSSDAVMVNDDINKNDPIKEDIMAEMTVKVDASEVKEAVKEAVNEINVDALKADIDTLTTEKTKLEAERDTLKDKVDSLEKKVTELEATKMDEATIKAAVARRMKILDAARIAEVEVKEDATEIDIQKAVITKVFPKANLDGKDEVYIMARFDGAIETLETKNDTEVRKANAEVVSIEKDDAISSEKARDEYIARLTGKK